MRALSGGPLLAPTRRTKMLPRLVLLLGSPILGDEAWSGLWDTVACCDTKVVNSLAMALSLSRAGGSAWPLTACNNLNLNVPLQ